MSDDNIISVGKIEFADLPPDYDREMFDRWATHCLIMTVWERQMMSYSEYVAQYEAHDEATIDESEDA